MLQLSLLQHARCKGRRPTEICRGLGCLLQEVSSFTLKHIFLLIFMTDNNIYELLTQPASLFLFEQILVVWL